MQCVHCFLEKISSDFPHCEDLACFHLPRTCLRCLVDRHQQGVDGCPECGTAIPSMSQLLSQVQMLDCPAFRDFDLINQMERQEALSASKKDWDEEGTIEVAVLDGRRQRLQVSRSMALGQVLASIQQKMEVPVSKQRLMYNGRSLTGGSSEAHRVTWGQLNVPFGSVIQLVVVMHQTNMGGQGCCESLIFDLEWDPVVVCHASGRDSTHFLNGSCLVLDRFGQPVTAVDFMNRSFESIHHEGPASKGNATQRITVDLSQLSPRCKYLFFVLSVFASYKRSSDLSMFRNPSVRLMDTSSGQVLHHYTARNAQRGKAVLLCCAKYDATGASWSVLEAGAPSHGNYKNYALMYKDAADLIESGWADH